MKNFLFLFLLSVVTIHSIKGAELTSPNGLISVKITVADRIYYSVFHEGIPLLEQCNLGIDVDGLFTNKNLKILNVKSSKISREIIPVVPMKFSKINELCNTVVYTFKNGFRVEFRAYNEGIAYRIITNFSGDKNGKIKINSEDVTLNLPDNYMLHLQPAKDFTSNYETNYIHVDSKTWKATDQMATLPALIDTEKRI